MLIDDITEKIIESKNNYIAKAFTMNIGNLLINNGIVPIITEYTRNDVKNITDTDEYKLVMEYGITFKELDCSKHDKEIYNKAIDDFAGRIIRYVDCGHLCSPSEMRWSDLSVVEMVKKLAEKLKKGGENE